MANNSPDPWLIENLHYLPVYGHVLDLACGSGRNARHLHSLGHHVTCADIDTGGVEDLVEQPRYEVIQADLENDNAWPFSQKFDGIIVINYLHRSLFPHLIESLAENGILIYKTFMQGNEKYGRPRDPDFLLQKGELLDVFGEVLDVLAFDQGYEEPPAVTQQICARKP